MTGLERKSPPSRPNAGRSAKSRRIVLVPAFGLAAAVAAGGSPQAAPRAPAGELRCLPESAASPFVPGRELLCFLLFPDGTFEEYAGGIRLADPGAATPGAEFHWSVLMRGSIARGGLAGTYRGGPAAAGQLRAGAEGSRAVLEVLPETGRWAGVRNLARLAAELTLRPGRPPGRRPPLPPPPHPLPRP
jgi:hypothetical protein